MDNETLDWSQIDLSDSYISQLNELFEHRAVIWADYDGTDGSQRMDETIEVDWAIWDLTEEYSQYLNQIYPASPWYKG